MNVCLVEPNELGNALLTRVLSREGYRVQAFTKGEAALDWLEKFNASCIVLASLNIEDISGHEFVWHCRLISTDHRPFYVVALDNPNHAAVAEALDSGADDFISKPLSMLNVYARLRAAQRTLNLQTRLFKQATRDPLTDVLNRRAFFQYLKEVCTKETGDCGPCLISLDIDHFKKINDTFGHDAGDQVIISVAQVLLEGRGLVARLGGEEFSVLIEGATIDQAMERANRLRLELAAQQVDCAGSLISFTASFGVTQWGGDADSLRSLLKRADVALYHSKSTGRNRVTRASAKSATDVTLHSLPELLPPIKKVTAA